MKKIFHIFSLLCLITVVTAACKNEEPFDTGVSTEGTGRILTTSIKITVNSNDFLTRASEDSPSVDMFTVAIYNRQDPETPYLSYPYPQLPEVLTLPVGTYFVKAFYGNNDIEAAFDNPYYEGVSANFTIQEGKIEDFKDPIVCSLSNVKVSILFDEDLVSEMSADSYVEVKVGENGTLIFKESTNKAGYFKYVDNSETLVATFYGSVQGEKVSESKIYDNVQKGTYYKITFKLHAINPGEEGNSGSKSDEESGTLKVDASVIYDVDANDGVQNVNPDSEEYLKDDLRPGYSGDPDDDGEGDVTPDTPEEKPVPPYIVSDDVDMEARTDISSWPEGKRLAIKILSATPLKQFKCKIDSELLTPEALEEVKLKSDLDLVNDIYDKDPGESESTLWSSLRDLGFPVGSDVTNPKEYVDGNYVITFDITQFVNLLNALGHGDHNFIFDMENEAGKSTATLKLKS
ncbi:MAG: DUF4493 domain-containing protein [Muribaculaceae bacterium]|nr:DUF4493 domain-containing protein [Muribaculaceae bacterium]